MIPESKIRGRSSRGRRSGRRNRPKNSSTAAGRYVSDAWSLAKRTATGLNEIRKLINIEHKFFDLNSNLTSTQAGTVQYLTGIAQGVDLSNRVGDSIKIQTLEFNATCYMGVTTPASCRIIIVRDLENGGAAIAGSDVLANVGGAGAATSLFNYINAEKRFAIIFDELISLDTSNSTQTLHMKMSHGGHIFFRDTTAAVTNGAEGVLYLLVTTDVAATGPTVRSSFRVTYTDD